MVAANGTINLYALFIGIFGGTRSNHGSAFGDHDSYRSVHDSAATVVYNTPFACCPPPRYYWQCHPDTSHPELDYLYYYLCHSLFVFS